MTESVNHEAVCRTAPATPGLLIIYCICIISRGGNIRLNIALVQGSSQGQSQMKLTRAQTIFHPIYPDSSYNTDIIKL